MKRYRSDWPEIGLDDPVADWTEDGDTDSRGCVQYVDSRELERGIHARIAATINELESEVYPFPCFELRMSACIEASLGGPECGVLAEWAEDAVGSILERLPADALYVYSKVVAGEPLHAALLKAGFRPVESRYLFRCRIGDLPPPTLGKTDDDIDYIPMTQVPSNLGETYRKQILKICSQSFRSGYSRHFRDPALSRAVPGVEYVVSLMTANFDNVPPSGFLLAIRKGTSEVSGFSVVGRKSGLANQTYTQLLSAVHPEYRRCGVYRGLTALIGGFFPREAALLNVTHEQSIALRNAYRKSGRKHLADTVVLSRFVHGCSQQQGAKRCR